jgi:hypothetical protein
MVSGLKVMQWLIVRRREKTITAGAIPFKLRQVRFEQSFEEIQGINRWPKSLRL